MQSLLFLFWAVFLIIIVLTPVYQRQNDKTIGQKMILESILKQIVWCSPCQNIATSSSLFGMKGLNNYEPKR